MPSFEGDEFLANAEAVGKVVVCSGRGVGLSVKDVGLFAADLLPKPGGRKCNAVDKQALQLWARLLELQSDYRLLAAELVPPDGGLNRSLPGSSHQLIAYHPAVPKNAADEARVRVSHRDNSATSANNSRARTSLWTNIYRRIWQSSYFRFGTLISFMPLLLCLLGIGKPSLLKHVMRQFATRLGGSASLIVTFILQFLTAALGASEETETCPEGCITLAECVVAAGAVNSSQNGVIHIHTAASGGNNLWGSFASIPEWVWPASIMSAIMCRFAPGNR